MRKLMKNCEFERAMAFYQKGTKQTVSTAGLNVHAGALLGVTDLVTAWREQ
jgi:hypothetical protein